MKVLWPDFRMLSGKIPDLSGFVFVALMDWKTRELLYVDVTDEDGFKKTLRTGEVFCRIPRLSGHWKLTVDGKNNVIREIRINAAGDTVVFLIERKGIGDRTFVGTAPVFYPFNLGLKRRSAAVTKRLRT